MLHALAALLVLQLAGKALVQLLALPVPGPVLGMALLFAAVGIARLLGASTRTALAPAPKSVTAPVAMGITEKLGGPASLTAIPVVSTGILGAVVGPSVPNLCGVRDPAVRGFAIGTTSHGIGTARAFQESEEAGAFSGLAMGLNTVVSSLVLPPLLRLIGPV
jgi:putative effector of murein hydrolase